jgi:hypothetical protein
MADLPLVERVAVLETKMEEANAFIANFDKALEVRFRAQAEMLDERFAGVDERFVDLNERLFGVNGKFASINGRFNKVDEQFVLIRKELGILREGMSTLLKRRRK